MTHAHALAGAAPGRIGPNAVIRLAEALRAVEGAGALERVFRGGPFADCEAHPPGDMVDEGEVRRLHGDLHQTVGDARARTIGWIAGQKTGDYLLAHRIPPLAQALMRGLPAVAAAPILCAAIRRNAWTFAGSGRLSIRGGRPLVLEIEDCPLCRDTVSAAPWCDFYAGTFERLFSRLVHPAARAVETHCQAMGGSACSFSIRW